MFKENNVIFYEWAWPERITRYGGGAYLALVTVFSLIRISYDLRVAAPREGKCIHADLLQHKRREHEKRASNVAAASIATDYSDMYRFK